LEEVAQLVQPLREELVSQLSGDVFCPGVDLNSVTGVDLNSIANNAATYLDGVENFTLPQAEVFQETLDTAQETADKVETISENITPQDWQALIFIVPFSIFAFLFLVGVALVWLDRNVTWYICILSWVMLPLFTILIIICFLCSGAIAIGASANAGKGTRVAMCYLLVYGTGSPERHNLRISYATPFIQISALVEQTIRPGEQSRKFWR
jgi:hypothetical protein